MTREEFSRLVGRIEARYARRPVRLRLVVFALALFSYLSLFVWLGLAFAIAAPFVALGVAQRHDPGCWIYFVVGGAVAAIGVYSTIRVLRVRIHPPEGLELRRADAPALFAELDAIRTRLRASRISRVTLSWSCNAGVCAVPRLGLLGWSRHHLELGLPLMEVLSVDQLHSVLAHEFAHISAQHGRVSGWVYRLRRSWSRAFERLGRGGRLSLGPALWKFFNWFWPRFSAHAFVLSRVHEFEADAVAARLYGQEPATSALLSIRLHGRLLGESFWPELWRNPGDEPEPPADVFDRLRSALEAGPAPAQSDQWLRESFRVFTSHEDTHPCLTDRWGALGCPISTVELAAAFPAPAPASAASVLFGENLPRIRRDLAALWCEKAKEDWHVGRARARLFREQAAALSQRTALRDRDDAPSRRTTEHEAEILWDRAQAALELHGETAALPLWREVLARRPAHPLANLFLGRSLLTGGDPAGEDHLERAMAADESLLPAAGDILSDHFTRNGDAARVREIRARLDRYDARVTASRTERNRVTAQDRFLPHDLTAAELAATQAVLLAEPDLESAFLARKDLHHFPEQRLFILVVRLTRRWYAPASAEKTATVVNRLVGRIQLPGRLLVIGETGPFAAVARKVKGITEAKFYPSSELH